MTLNIAKPILSVETSGEVCGASIFFNEKKFFEINLVEKNIHSEKLLEVVEAVLKKSLVKINEIGLIAVSSGPGSFTGLRIGMSAAKGLAFGANLPIIPVPTFEALALKICDIIPDKTEFIICNKVNSEEIYFGRFINLGKSYQMIEKIKVIKLNQLKNYVKSSDFVFGNAKIEEEHHNRYQNISAPEAFFIAKWAYLFGKDLLTFNYDFLEPNYLKNFLIR
jgi:tRNA threonylcarbamoyladenosine biosynthesis protein TsaB